MKNETISKSEFKPKALHYFRIVEQTGKEFIISDRGKPVVKIVPYKDSTEDTLKALRNTVKSYIEPTQPVGLDEWEVLK
ncbi:MAG: type II toxin-antitoxin system Phd/YefM family antitoxin [Desulfatitalea sp.]